ncbi:hypothetical protein ACQPXB_21380 [Amycolatopsis sp. CA-161197]|uniref:hypothetical protein n=1 Tax=Amycolatopsis sp. CA-161197 TaxID=3239922 RepID=UPI003D91A2DD
MQADVENPLGIGVEFGRPEMLDVDSTGGPVAVRRVDLPARQVKVHDALRVSPLSTPCPPHDAARYGFMEGGIGTTLILPMLAEARLRGADLGAALRQQDPRRNGL